MKCVPIALLSFGFVLVAGATADLNAQVRDPTPVEEAEFSFDLTKTFFDDDGVGALTFTLMPRLVVPASDKASLFLEWGISQARINEENSITLSNPRVGVAFGGSNETTGFASITLPLAKEIGDDDFATGFGFFSDYERIETFFPDIVAVEAAVLPRKTLDSGATIGGRIGGAFLVPTGDQSGNAELFVRPAAFGELVAGSARIGAEVSSSILATESDVDFGDRASTQVTLFLRLPESSSAPTFYLRLPVDGDFNDVVTFVLGARATL